MGIVIAVSRYVLPFVTVVILTKCMLSLLLGHPKEKIYGYITDLTDGENYPLNMWETSIGRSNSCDIVIGYDTVSRFQAVISRRIDGWYIYDLLSKSGIEVNGEKIDGKTTIKNGDVLTFGIVQYRFAVANDPIARVGKKKMKGRQEAPQYYERPYRPQQNTAAFSQNDFNPASNPQRPQGSAGFSQQPFYDEKNKPDLNFEKPNDGTTGSPFSRQNSFTVETPPRGETESYSYNGSRPAVVNKDTGETFILCGDTVTIGRSRNCDIKLSSPTVSRHHADLVLYEDGWAIVDAGSSAGTFLNGNRINQPQLLFDGDVIAISDERLFYVVKTSSQRRGG